MNYVALIDGEERQVEIAEISAGRYQLVVDGRTLHFDARPVSDSTLSLLHEHQAYNIELEDNPNGRGKNVLVRGHLVNVEVLDLRALRLRKAAEVASGPDGPAEVAAPMPGKIVDVLVEEGQEVEEGLGLIVVEAMKMENELRSPRSGVIRSLKAVKGQAVEAGVVLCVVSEKA